MAGDGSELIVALICVVALLLAPLASRLINDVGVEISRELDGGRVGEHLTRHLDQTYNTSASDPEAARHAEIRQLLEARAFVIAERGGEPLDVERRYAEILARES